MILQPKFLCIVLAGLLSLLATFNCNKKSPVDPDSRPGKVTVLFRDPDDFIAPDNWPAVAELTVREDEHRISLTNAAFLDIPDLKGYQSVTIWGEGNFDGVDDQFVILLPDSTEDTRLASITVRPPQYTSILISIGGELNYSGRIYGFVLDTDNNNSGVMTAFIKFGDKTERFDIDASVNTILLDNAAKLDSIPTHKKVIELYTSIEGNFNYHFDEVLLWSALRNTLQDTERFGFTRYDMSVLFINCYNIFDADSTGLNCSLYAFVPEIPLAGG